MRELPHFGTQNSFCLRDVDRSLFPPASARNSILPLSEAEDFCISGIETLLLKKFGHRVLPYELKAWTDSELSFVRSEKKQVTSLFLTQLIGEELFIDYLYDSSENPKISMGLITRFLAQTDEFCLAPTTLIHVTAITGDMERMLDKMTSGKMKETGALTVWTRRI